MNFKKTLLILYLSVGIYSISEASSYSLMLYKHYTLDISDWTNIAPINNRLIDPNGDGNTSDSTWTSPSQAAAVTTTSSTTNNAPTQPSFNAYVTDSIGSQIGEIY